MRGLIAIGLVACGFAASSEAPAAPLEPTPRVCPGRDCDTAAVAVVLRHEAGSSWRVASSIGAGGRGMVGRTAEVPRLDPAGGPVLLVKPDRASTWDRPRPVSANAAAFLAARAEKGPEARLADASRYVADRDATIAAVCFSDLAAAEFRDVAVYAARLPRARLEDRLRRGLVPPGDLRVHGILLGLCGTAETASLCEGVATEPLGHCDIGVGVEGLWIGVLLADPVYGSDRAAAAVGPGEDCQSRVRAVLEAADWVWRHAPERVERNDLIRVVVAAAMRPEGRDLAAATLSDWRAWDAAERVIAIYAAGGRDDDRDRAGRIAMLRYLRRALDEPRALPPATHSKVASAVRRIERAEPDIARRATILSGRRAASREVF